MKQHKFVDLSGYSFTGKHAVIDLLREFEGYFVEHYTFEFSLLRIQGGILDLEDALENDWSPIRSDAAIRRFKRLIVRLDGKNSYMSPSSWFTAVGTNYRDHYRGKFLEISERYISKLLAASWKCPWPYPSFELSGPELFGHKLLKKLRGGEEQAVEYHLAFTNQFVPLTTQYLHELLSSNVPEGFRSIVMHNAFEPFNPQRSLKYFPGGKAIVVDRDPRDNYVQMSGYAPLRVPVELFVKRYRIQREAAQRFRGKEKDVLRLRFEDLVLHYQRNVNRIIAFLGEKKRVHVAPRKYFDPAISVRNIGLWKTHPRQDEMDYIYKNLRDYCFRG